MDEAKLKQIAHHAALMPWGPYFYAGWTVGNRGFEVGDEKRRNRIAADMEERSAKYLALLDPDTVLELVKLARVALQQKQETANV